MIRIDRQRAPRDLLPKIERVFALSGRKIRSIEETWRPEDGAPVFTVRGRYQARGWTEWTQGFQFGSALLQFDATGDRDFLELGRSRTLERMAPHLTHMGVHDHGFNNVSTYGNLWRLAREGRMQASDWEVRFYELALNVSGAVQARRWTRLPDTGFIHSFNGAHSLFVDTIRSLRALALGFLLGQRLMEEQDASVSLLERLVHHARATARYSVYYGRGRDRFDVRGRVAHESLFNVANGTYRGPSTQQGYSPFTTWTRGLAWAMLGFAEQLEFLEMLPDAALDPCGGRAAVASLMLEAARATSDYYIEIAAADGVPYWDTGAPGLAALKDWGNRPADPFNDREPVDSSAAAIAAQGLLRLAHVLAQRGDRDGERYEQAGLRALDTLFDAAGPYLSVDPDHQGLLLHSVYHWPNGWDYVPPGRPRRAANRASGGTITPARPRCTCSVLRKVRRISRSSGRQVVPAFRRTRIAFRRTRTPTRRGQRWNDAGDAPHPADGAGHGRHAGDRPRHRTRARPRRVGPRALRRAARGARDSRDRRAPRDRRRGPLLGR